MNDTHRQPAPSRYTLPTIAALFAALITGCISDHRMSVTELQYKEHELRAQAAPPPADEQTQQATQELINRQLGPYRLGPGDVLAVSVTELSSAAPLAPIPARVDRGGNIDLPTVGPVKVGGLELEDAEAAVKAAYVPNVFKDATVYVKLTEPQATRVVVTGAVTAPSVVQLPRTERNVLFAINGAGGLSDTSSGQVTLRRIRQPAEEVVIDIKNPDGLAAALAIEPLEDGDLLRVHAAMPNIIFVGGLVNAPQPQHYPAGVNVTVLQSLVGAGGLRMDLFPREATLIRRMPDGSDAHVRLDLLRIQSGQDPNIELAAGDVLWVPHTIETRIEEFLNRNVFLRGGAVVTYDVQGFEDLHSRFDSRTAGNLEDTFDPFGFFLP
jgi:protein involved in polysaccharide export with SLBB domain